MVLAEGVHRVRDAHLVGAVGDVAEEGAGILRRHGERAGREVETIGVGELRVALVERDDRDAGRGRGQREQLRHDLRVRREIARRGGSVGVDGEEVIAFVAAVVLEINEAVAVGAPAVFIDAAGAVMRDRAVGAARERADEDVHLPAHRFEIGDAIARGRDAHLPDGGVAEELRNGNDRRRLGRGEEEREEEHREFDNSRARMVR